MDFGTIGERLPFIIATVVFVILWQYFRGKRKPEVGRQEIVRRLLLEVKLNQALAGILDQQPRPRRFETVSWLRSKSKLDFLDRSLKGALSNAFDMVEDYNQQLNMAKKYRSSGSLATINVSKLEDALDKSSEGLEQWLRMSTGTKDSPPKHPSFFERLLGG